MISDFQRKKLVHLFNLLDLSESGNLQLNDFAELAEKVRIKLNYEDRSKEHEVAVRKSVKFFYDLLREIPDHQDQTISLEQWLDYFDENVVNSDDDDVISDHVQFFLDFLFGLFDENRDGFISIDEYIDIFEVFGLEKSHLAKAFIKLDLNADERLSRYELIPAIETFLQSDDPEEVGNWVFGAWD
ncbi:hypothetical protein [Marinoscillum sp. MHG1-6]|uniref:hypothetical protein n=1 Tax=Marinoscillum sp. MHG1-6 TaxID=2959627 RepID=UPI00215762A5|nr:hypothetical protein [Marinoscillum sp. MHG1-6]